MLLNTGDEEINEEWEQLQVSIKGTLLCFQFFFFIWIAKLMRNGNLGWQIHYIWPSLQMYATNLSLTPKNSYCKLSWLQLLARKCSVEFHLHVQGEMQSAMDASYPSGWYLSYI